jgi:hypothetical protein
MIYKIRNPHGLYSTGGSPHRITWTKQGKTWVALNHLRAHLKLSQSDPAYNPYVGCVVEEFVMQLTTTSYLLKGVNL